MLSRYLWVVFLGSAVAFAGGCDEQDAADPAAAIARAEKHLAEGNPGGAIVELKSLLQADPDNQQGRWKLAGLYLEVGDWAAAEASLRRAQELGIAADSVVPKLAQSLLKQGKQGEVLAIDADTLTDTRAKALVYAAKSLASLETGDTTAARSAVDAAIARAAEAPEVRLSDAAVTAKEGAVSDAEKKALSLTQSAPEFSAGWSLLGDFVRIRKDLEAAERAYTKAIDTSLFHPGELYNRALVRIEMEKLDEAQEDIEKLARTGAIPTETNYAHGVLLVARGESEKALEKFKAALKLSVNHPGSLLNAGSIKLDLGETELARDYLSRAVSADPEAYHPRKVLATMGLREGNYQNVLSLMGPMIDSGRLDEDGAMLAVQALVLAGRTNQAVEIASRFAESAPDSSKAQYMLGFVQLLQGAESDALKRFDAALSMDQDFVAVDETLIRYYLGRKQYEKALVRALGVKERTSSSTESINLVGLVHLMSGESAQAEAAFLEVDAADPGNVAANAGLARIAVRSGNKKNAEKRYERILEFHENSLVALNGIARLAAQRGDSEATRTYLTRAVETHPYDLRSRIALARLELLSGNSDRALTLLEDAYSTHYEDSAYLRNYVLSLVSTRNIEKARREAERLVRLDPDSVEARYLLARVLLALDQPANAKEQLALVVSRNPTNVTAQEDYIRLLLLDGDPQKAESQFAELERVVPPSEISMSLRAAVALAINDPESAKNALGRSREQANADADARTLMLLAVAEDQLGNSEEALQVLEQIVVAAPENITARFYLANLMSRTGRNADGTSQLEEIIKLDEGNVRAMNNLAWELRYSNPEKALPYAQKAHELAPESLEIADTLITVQLAALQVQSAERTAERALEQHPGNPLLLYRQATIFVAKGMKHEARRQIEEVLSKHAEFPERDAAEELSNKLKQDLNGEPVR
jgi:putative PEP-CTERM system TPR-repeat lipoprotein